MNRQQEVEDTMAGIRFSVTLPADLVHVIETYAEQEDRSRNKMIRVLLTEAHAVRLAHAVAATHRTGEEATP